MFSLRRAPWKDFLTPVWKAYDFFFFLIRELLSFSLLLHFCASVWLSSADPIADIFQSSAPVFAITVLLFISCCGKLFWQSTVMNHLAKAFGKGELRFHRPLSTRIEKTTTFNSFLLLFHVSCSFFFFFFSFLPQCFKSYSLQALPFSSCRASQSKYLAGLVHKRSAFTCLRCWRQDTLCYVGGLEKQNFAG